MKDDAERLRGRMAMNEAFRRYYRARLSQAEQALDSAFNALLADDPDKALADVLRYYGASDDDLAKIGKSRTSDF